VFILLFSDVLVHQKELSVDLILAIESLNCSLCVFVADVLAETLFRSIVLDFDGLDVSELAHQLSELLMSEVFWNVHDVQVGVEVLTIIALFGVFHHSNLLVRMGGFMQRGDSLLSSVGFFVLDECISSAFAVSVDLKLAGNDGSKLLEEIVNLALRHILRQICNQNVCVGIEFLVFLFVEHELLSVKKSIVLFIVASNGFLLGEEIEVSKAPTFSCSLIKHNFSVLEFVALGCEVLEEVVFKCC
jgi:hypothetical protein